ncbi:MAG: nickel pincer cofactor biosynthesis protein LarC [Kamptonema sp. SIO1D9]|nr:nickel pincer cofactor biosynthesis protein LarC [Kamptonema sp. SIO1D9]
MRKVAYLECPTGIAGDMCLGALVDAGVPLDYLVGKLQSLGLEQEYRLRAEKVRRNAQIATKVYVDLLHLHHSADESDHHSARHLPEIEALIQAAELPFQAKSWSLQVFRQLAIAEGAVHGISPEKVHFHEVGATDAIVDIVGTCLGLDWLGICELFCSALPTGGGTVKAAHGILPVPVPAVLKLLSQRQVPVYSNGIEKELVTPTGAAIATTLATNFGSPPPMQIETIGLGAGSQEFAIPNILRLWVGQETGNVTKSDNLGEIEAIATLQTQIDDLSPQAIAYTFDRLFAAGAVDVFTQPINMKKSRSGILLTVICPPEKIAACETVIFRETTTLGIRRLTQPRTILPREIQQVKTEYGTVRVKIAFQGNPEAKNILNVQPEYEDCAQIARENNLPWRVIYQMVLDAWHRQNTANH